MEHYPAIALVLTLICLCLWVINNDFQKRPLDVIDRWFDKHSDPRLPPRERNDTHRGALMFAYAFMFLTLGPLVALPCFLIFGLVYTTSRLMQLDKGLARNWRADFDLATDWMTVTGFFGLAGALVSG